MEANISSALTVGLACPIPDSVDSLCLISSLEKEYEPSTSTTTLSKNMNCGQVSTALTLWDSSWNHATKKRKTQESDSAPRKSPSLIPIPIPNPNPIQISAKKMRKTLAMPRGPWVIRKKLTKTDIGNCTRLLLVPKNSVMDHVLCFLDAKSCSRVDSEEGLRVIVRDCDTDTNHQLIFKNLKNLGYILNGGWRQMFVNRRQLKENDEIGVYWDASTTMFMFSLLQRANPLPQLLLPSA